MHAAMQTDAFSSLKELQADIVLACRILVDQHMDSGPFGNVSIRIPGTQQFCVNPAGIPFQQLEVDDILRVDIHGHVHQGRHEVHPGEFIHREIYRLRADVNAIVHTHSFHTVALSLLGCEIEPFTQLGASLYNDQGVYQGFSGPVRSSHEGLAIAQALANKSLVIAKNHGVFATGASIQAALWDMMLAEEAAKIHLTARQLGLIKAERLSADTLQKSKVEVRERQHQFMWRAFQKKLGQ